MTLLRNCVLPEVGKYILDEVLKEEEVDEIRGRENQPKQIPSTDIAGIRG